MSRSGEKSGISLFGYLASIPIILILSIWGMNKLAYYGNGTKANEADARNLIKEIIRYQQEYYSKNKRFSNNSLESINSSSTNYDFKVDLHEDKVIIFARLKSKNLAKLDELIHWIIYPDIVGKAKNFVGGTFVTSANLKAIICKSQNFEFKELNSLFLKSENPVCPANTDQEYPVESD